MLRFSRLPRFKHETFTFNQCVNLFATVKFRWPRKTLQAGGGVLDPSPCVYVMYTVYYVILRTYNTAENVWKCHNMHAHVYICIYVFVLYSDDCIIYITLIYSATPNPSTVALLHGWLPSMGQIHTNPRSGSKNMVDLSQISAQVHGKMSMIQ